MPENPLTDDMRAQLRRHRQQTFAVRIVPDGDSLEPGDSALQVSHGGMWMTTRLNATEAFAVWLVLGEAFHEQWHEQGIDGDLMCPTCNPG